MRRTRAIKGEPMSVPDSSPFAREGGHVVRLPAATLVRHRQSTCPLDRTVAICPRWLARLSYRRSGHMDRRLVLDCEQR